MRISFFNRGAQGLLPQRWPDLDEGLGYYIGPLYHGLSEYLATGNWERRMPCEAPRPESTKISKLETSFFLGKLIVEK